MKTGLKWPPYRRGHCYQNAGDFVRKNPAWTLCHGVVECADPNNPGQMGHAWAEIEIPGFGIFCADQASGKKLVTPACLYYAAGRISHVVRYEVSEAKKRMFETKSYGPWCPIVQSATHADDEKPTKEKKTNEKQ